MSGSFCILHFASRAYRRAVRWAFERLYREFAWAYDAVAAAVSRGLWRRWAAAALPFLRRGRVLELGFGPGHLQVALASADSLPFGVDASPQMAAVAARRIARSGRPARLARAVAQHLPFPAHSFDSVLATFPAEYIADPRTHAEIARVLAPGGRVVVVPMAQLDQSLYTRIVDLAYRLTLQAPLRRDDPRAASVEGLRVGDIPMAAQWVAVGPSRALVMVGERPDEEPNGAEH